MAICYPRAAGRKIERASASAIQWALKMEGLGAGGWVGLVLAEVPEGTKHCVGPWLCPGSALITVFLMVSSDLNSSSCASQQCSFSYHIGK